MRWVFWQRFYKKAYSYYSLYSLKSTVELYAKFVIFFVLKLEFVVILLTSWSQLMDLLLLESIPKSSLTSTTTSKLKLLQPEKLQHMHLYSSCIGGSTTCCRLSTTCDAYLLFFAWLDSWFPVYFLCFIPVHELHIRPWERKM